MQFDDIQLLQKIFKQIFKSKKTLGLLFNSSAPTLLSSKIPTRALGPVEKV